MKKMQCSVFNKSMIRSTSFSKQIAVVRWIEWTGLAFIILLLSCICVDAPRIMTYYRLRSEMRVLKEQVVLFDQLLERKRILKQEEQFWLDHNKKIEQLGLSERHLFDSILAVMHAAGSDVSIQSCAVDKKSVMFTVFCSSMQRAFLFFDSLNQQKRLFGELVLKSVHRQADGDLWVVSIQGGLSF